MPIQWQHVRIGWGRLLFVTAMAGWCAWYFGDTLAVSHKLENLLLILPVFSVLILLYSVIIIQEILAVRAEASVKSKEELPTVFSYTRLKIPIVMLLFGLYIYAMPKLGFDVTSFLFLMACLIFLGERRFFFVVIYSAIFSALLSLALTDLVTYPTKMLVF